MEITREMNRAYGCTENTASKYSTDMDQNLGTSMRCKYFLKNEMALINTILIYSGY